MGNTIANRHGGGISSIGSIPFSFHPFINIRNNEITNNKIESWHAEGGGIFILDENGNARDTIEGNNISYNEVSASGSSGYAIGGGIAIYNPNEGSFISNNIISNNSAIEGPPGSDRRGGGIYLIRNPSLPLEYNAVIKNNRITGNAAIDGAGIFFQTIGARLINNFISGNQAETGGGALYFSGTANNISIAEVINNTITSNSANGQGGEAGSIYFNANNSLLLMNNIFFGNQAETSDEMKIMTGTVQMNNCDINIDEITGTWTGANNLYADPEFIDEMTWDCWANEAPCSNAGIEKIFAFNQWFEGPAEDIMNNARPQDDFFDVGAVEVNMCFVGYPETVGSGQLTVDSYPNPFSSSTTFDYILEEPGMVTLEIFNQVGQMEVVLVNEQQTTGRQNVQWDADGMPAGIYYYSLRSGKQVHTGKVIVMK
jgi:hypothetical protein